jgi:hypothetical protein
MVIVMVMVMVMARVRVSLMVLVIVMVMVLMHERASIRTRVMTVFTPHRGMSVIFSICDCAHVHAHLSIRVCTLLTCESRLCKSEILHLGLCGYMCENLRV